MAAADQAADLLARQEAVYTKIWVENQSNRMQNELGKHADAST